MRYQSATGLDVDDILELTARMRDILEGRQVSLKHHKLNLLKQVELTLFLLRRNVSQTVAADLYGIS